LKDCVKEETVSVFEASNVPPGPLERKSNVILALVPDPFFIWKRPPPITTLPVETCMYQDVE
jgi:hypothetical protein